MSATQLAESVVAELLDRVKGLEKASKRQQRRIEELQAGNHLLNLESEDYRARIMALEKAGRGDEASAQTVEYQELSDNVFNRLLNGPESDGNEMFGETVRRIYRAGWDAAMAAMVSQQQGAG